MAACVVLAVLLLRLEAQTHWALPAGVRPAPPGGSLSSCILVSRLSRQAPSLTHPGCLLPTQSGAVVQLNVTTATSALRGGREAGACPRFLDMFLSRCCTHVHCGQEAHRGRHTGPQEGPRWEAGLGWVSGRGGQGQLGCKGPDPASQRPWRGVDMRGLRTGRQAVLHLPWFLAPQLPSGLVSQLFSLAKRSVKLEHVEQATLSFSTEGGAISGPSSQHPPSSR